MYLRRVFKLLLTRWRSSASGSAFVWKLALERHFKFLTSPLTHSPWAFQSLWKQNILGSFNSESLFWFSQYKVGCDLPIVIWSEFHKGQYRHDTREYAPHLHTSSLVSGKWFYDDECWIEFMLVKSLRWLTST